MTEHIKLYNGKYGLRADVSTAWSTEIANQLVKNQILELELNQGKGWRGTDLSFLSAFTQLRAFKIIDFRIKCVTPIHCLRELRSLDVITYCQTEIKFSAFPQLEKCGLEWRPKAASLFDAMMLKELYINRYEGKDVIPFTKLTNLESLAILNTPVRNLYGLSVLKRLRSLRLGNLRRLTSLAGIEGLENLEVLEIDTCRLISSIEELRTLRRLRRVGLNNLGNIVSLKALDQLDGLESLGFVESTNVLDGDISPIIRLKNLSSISFQNRRHYSHRREDFGVAYSGRPVHGGERPIADP